MEGPEFFVGPDTLWCLFCAACAACVSCGLSPAAAYWAAGATGQSILC